MLSTIRMVKYNPTLLIEATGKRVDSVYETASKQKHCPPKRQSKLPLGSKTEF